VVESKKGNKISSIQGGGRRRARSWGGSGGSTREKGQEKQTINTFF